MRNFDSAYTAQQFLETVESTPWNGQESAHLATHQFNDVLPRIQALAMRTSEWITVIGGSRHVIDAMVQSGISRARIRWVVGKNQDQREWATEQALLASTSSVVLSWLDDLTPRMQQRLKMASKVSHTHSFVFNALPSLTPLH
ncbi:MAG TPA: hypothetical protein VFM61_00905 [Pseudidiomarina sp.]|nr:hypothetical protein [Pseudidiomarina sp.]